MTDYGACPISRTRRTKADPVRRRMAGQLSRRRKRRMIAGDEDPQLQLPLSESGDASTPPESSSVTTPAEENKAWQATVSGPT